MSQFIKDQNELLAYDEESNILLGDDEDEDATDNEMALGSNPEILEELPLTGNKKTNTPPPMYFNGAICNVKTANSKYSRFATFVQVQCNQNGTKALKGLLKNETLSCDRPAKKITQGTRYTLIYKNCRVKQV